MTYRSQTASGHGKTFSHVFLTSGKAAAVKVTCGDQTSTW